MPRFKSPGRPFRVAGPQIRRKEPEPSGRRVPTRRLQFEVLETRSLLSGGGENILLVVNPGDENALRIANAYQQLRGVPDRNIIFLTPPTSNGSYRFDLTAAEFNTYYVAPLAAAITSRGLTNIDYIATLGQATRYTSPSYYGSDTKNSVTYGLSLLTPLAAGLSTDNAVHKVTGLYYSNVSNIPIGSNTAIYHSQHYTINYGSAGAVDTQYYMAGTLGYTWIRGNTADQVIAGLARAVGADGTHPAGTIYFEQNSDIRSTTRQGEWAATQTQLAARGIPYLQEVNVSGSTPLNRSDVLGAVIGNAGYVAPNGSTYVAGSWADNLTSHGATWDERGQTKDSRLIASGVIATTGSVVEPYADSYRFTNSSIYTFLADGSTAAEAFAKSVATPDIQLFMGDLLAQPSADVPIVSLNGGPAEGAAVSGTVAFDVSSALSGARIATAVARLELLVDGVLTTTITGGAGTFNLDTSTLSDGRHEIRLVAVNNALAESEGYLLRNIVVNNHGRSATASAASYTISGSGTLPVTLSAAIGDGTLVRIQLRQMGRAIGQVTTNGGKVTVNGSQLAYGDNRLVPVAVFSDGKEVAGAPITVRRDPIYLAGQTPTGNLTPGLRAEYFLDKGSTSISASDFSGTPNFTVGTSRLNLGNTSVATSLDRTPDALATTAVDKLGIRFSGKFTVAADQTGEYQFYLWKTNDSAEITIDGQRVAGFDNATGGFTTNQVTSVFLGAGEHDFVLRTANVVGSDSRFDISVEYRGPDGITRIIDSSSFGYANLAPTLDNSGELQFSSIAEDDTLNNGMLVSDLLASAGGTPISDPDGAAAQGIAITAADYGNGMWQYKIGAAGAWTDLARPSVAAARLLASDNATWLRFVPSVNWNGTLENAITFRAWDRAAGTAGGTADVSVGGGNTSFSTAQETARIVLTSVADAPAISVGAVDTTMVADTGVTSLRLNNLTFSTGGADEQSQTLTFTVTAVPNAARGTVVRAGDTVAITVGQNLTIDELRGLRFLAAAGSTAASDQFSFTAVESGGTALSSTFTLTLDVVHRSPLTLLGDLETTIDSSDPANFATLGGIAYFTASDPLHGNELWRSDGTAAGTWLVKDIQPGTRSSSIGSMTAIGSLIYFSANDGINGQELWATDGTAGNTYLVKDLNTGLSNSATPNSASPGNLVTMGGILYFTAYVSSYGTELLRSDGTPDGTYIVKDIYSGSSSASPGRLTVCGSTLYFTANNGSTGTELWKSDGTSAGTTLVKDITSGSTGSTFTATAAAGDKFFFALTDAATGNELWISDGSSAGTVLVKDIVGGSGSSTPSNLIGVGNTLYFTATDGNGTELWKSDGTTAGTLLAADIYNGVTSSSPTLLTVIGSTLYFRATDGNGAELWKYDGTSASRVADIYAGTGSSTPSNLVNVSGTLFFTATTSAAGTELWKSDGTAGGTMLVKELASGGSSGSYANLSAAGSRLFFRGSTVSTNRELWTSDGTSGGTYQVLDIATGSTLSSNPNTLVTLNGKLYFIATTAAAGTELWTSDGTAAGTSILKDINPGTGSAGVANLRVVGSRLYFSANSGSTGAELWMSDGTTAGTALVKDINPAGNSSSPANFVDVSGTVYFTASDGTNGTELWKTDGTAANTVMVRDITAGSGGSTITGMVALGSKLLFACNDSTYGTEIWSSDGTSDGTTILKDIYSGTSSSSPAALTPFGTYVYFSANDGTTGTEPWRTDGTATGTVRQYDVYSGSGSSSPDLFTAVGSVLYFAGANSTVGRELFRMSGTTYAYYVGDVNSGTGNSYPVNLTAWGSAVYYTAYSPTYGTELYKSTSSTAPVVDIRTGTGSSNPGSLAVLGTRLFFRADDGVTGPELWYIDGTTNTASRLADLQPGAIDSYPQYLTALTNTLVFRATDGIVGDELWAWSDAAPTAGTIADRAMPVAAGAQTVKLWSSFEDDVDLDSHLTYSVVGNTNTALVGTSIDAATGLLTLSPQAGVIGTSQITIRATDRMGQYVETSFNASRSAPTATVSLNSHTPGSSALLTATAITADADGDAVTLTYVWKVNNVVKRTVVTNSLTDSFDLSVPGNGDVNDLITVEVTPSDQTATGTAVTDSATVLVTPLTLASAYVRGSTWNSATLQAMADGAAGDTTLGFRLVDGTSQLANSSTIVLSKPDQLTLRFNEAVNVTQSSLVLYNSQNQVIASTGFSKLDARTAQWTFAPLAANKYWFQVVAANTTDAGGLMLDGEWTTSTTTYATSGNGLPGGDLNFRFNVLAGDANGDGTVNVSDVLYLRPRLGAPLGATNWKTDLNASGGINTSDVISLRAWLGVSLGNFSEPTLPASLSEFSSSAEMEAATLVADPAMVAVTTGVPTPPTGEFSRTATASASAEPAGAVLPAPGVSETVTASAPMAAALPAAKVVVLDIAPAALVPAPTESVEPAGSLKVATEVVAPLPTAAVEVLSAGADATSLTVPVVASVAPSVFSRAATDAAFADLAAMAYAPSSALDLSWIEPNSRDEGLLPNVRRSTAPLHRAYRLVP